MIFPDFEYDFMKNLLNLLIIDKNNEICLQEQDSNNKVKTNMNISDLKICFLSNFK